MLKERNSNLELLRLFCIFGIVCMHSFGSAAESLSGNNLSWQLFINSIFDAGVTCFILISGYYGIQFRIKKMAALAMMVLFYSLCGLGCSFIIGETVGLEDIVKSFLPILSRKYWFVSCYFWLAALSPFINLIPGNMNKKAFEKLLILLLVLFSIIPTFLYFEIMQDSGRGMAHMILIYLIGRYIAIYGKKEFKRGRLFIILVCSVSITFILDWLLTNFSNRYFSPFSRNCSLTIIITSIVLFLLFKSFSIQHKWINVLAGNVLAVYVFERSMRSLLSYYVVTLSEYAVKWYFTGVVLLYALLVVFLCFLIESIRKSTIGRAEPFISEKIEMFVTNVYCGIDKVLE